MIISCLFLNPDGDVILEILNYIKTIFIFSEEINDYTIYVELFYVVNSIIFLDIILMLIILLTIKKIKLKTIILIINLINIMTFYYLICPAIQINIMALWCENGKHKFLQKDCFSSKIHLIYFIISVFSFLFYIFITFIYAIYCNEIGAITNNINEKIIRIHCKYELFCNVIKIIIFIFYYFLKIKQNIYILKLIYEGLILISNIIMLIYTYKYVYYYNTLINYIIYFGWSLNFWFSLSIFLKILFEINSISSFIIIGWIIILILLYKLDKMKEFSLIAEKNILELKSIKSIEIYKNSLLKYLSIKSEIKSKTLLFGNIKNFEEYIDSNPEINYQFQKLLNDKYLNHKFVGEVDLPILSIIYILYSIQLEKSSNKLEIALYMSYFLINKFNNPSYAISLCSKIKASDHIGLYYKYLLSEDIKEFLSDKINDLKKDSIKHIQIGSVILYYLYNDIFRMRIYDAVCNRIEYFDILKSSITTNKSTENFLRLGETIRKTRKVIMKVWQRLLEINPFSDESRKYYMIYIDIILQDDFLSKNETKKYTLLKNSKIEERFNTYHCMFLSDLSTMMLVDGYLSNGKILYASENFPFLFYYNVKELLSITIEELLPNAVQAFHKELVEDAIKYSNINYIFKRQSKKLLKTKNGDLVNIKLFLKPTPNLTYGLTFFVYIQKINDPTFTIVLDKDLKINGFTEIAREGDIFTVDRCYNLSQELIGSHIGIVIPDILPLLEYKNEEFNIINNGLELKGYLYQVRNIYNLKSNVDNILEKIKNNNKNNNITDEQMKVEENLQNINEEFNELISELNKESNPYSIFYRIIMYSFLDGKFKYYRILISDDIITENEIGQSPVDNQGNKRKKFISEMKSETSISKLSFNNKNDKKNTKKVIVKNNLIQNSNNDMNNEDQNNNNNNGQEDIKNNENEEKVKNDNLIPSNSQSNATSNKFDKLKIDIVNKENTIQIRIMYYLCLFFWILTIFSMIYNESTIKNCFENLSTFLDQNIFFNITKMNIAVVYILSLNIKWQLHSCNISNGISNMTLFYEKLLTENIANLLVAKNVTNTLYVEYKEIIEKKYDTALNIFGIEEKEIYHYNFDNIITFIINSGINILDKYSLYLEKMNKNKIQIDKTVYGINDLYDLINQSYYFFISDINGFRGTEKKKKAGKVFNNFPIGFVINGFFLIIISIFYIIYTLRMHKIEIYFLEKLINFNTVNFDGFLKQLDELKKKFRNDTSEEEDKEDNENDSEREGKKEEEEDDDEKPSAQKNKLNSQKHEKKKKKKDGNKLKQKKNKVKIMISFFIKINLFFCIKILIIMVISLTYYTFSILIEEGKKNEFMDFDSANDEVIGIFKSSLDIFISLKRQLELYEESLIECKISEEKEIYKMNIPSISEIQISNFGDNIVVITGGSGYKKDTLQNFSDLFSGNACNLLAYSTDSLEICSYLMSGTMTKGMEQTMTKMGNTIGTIIEELNSINNRGKEFNELIKSSTFFLYEIYIEKYYQRAFLCANEIFRNFRLEKLNSIHKLLKIILILYLILFNILVLFLIYFIYNSKSVFNSFLNFIWILPVKYLSEDEAFYKEIIKFGKESF